MFQNYCIYMQLWVILLLNLKRKNDRGMTCMNEWIYLRTLKHKYFYEWVIWECESAWNNAFRRLLVVCQNLTGRTGWGMDVEAVLRIVYIKNNSIFQFIQSFILFFFPTIDNSCFEDLNKISVLFRNNDARHISSFFQNLYQNS